MSVDLVRRVVADDTETLDLLDRAMQRPAHIHADSDISTVKDPNKRGTSRDYSLRKLRKDAPELHADVLAGRVRRALPGPAHATAPAGTRKAGAGPGGR